MSDSLNSDDHAGVSPTDTESAGHAVACLIAQAERYFNEGKLDAALPCLREAMALRLETGDESGHAHLAQTVGFLCFRLRDHDAAVTAYHTALAYRSKAGDPYGQAVTLGRLAEVHQHRGNHSVAIRLLNDSLALLCSQTNFKDIGTTLNNLGMSYYETNQPVDAMTCFQKAFLIRHQVGDLDGLAATLLNLSLLHAEEGDFALAADALSEAKDIHTITGDKLGLCRTILRLGMLQVDMKDNDAGRQHFQTALALATDAGVSSADDEAAALYNLGNLALRDGDWNDAQPLLKQAERILEKSGPNIGLGMVQYCLGRLHVITGRPSDALAYFTQAKAIQQSGDDLARLSGTLLGIGVVLSSMGKQVEAIAHFEQAQAIQREMHLHALRAETLKWLTHANAQLQIVAAALTLPNVAIMPALPVAIDRQQVGACSVMHRQGFAYGAPGHADFEFPMNLQLPPSTALFH